MVRPVCGLPARELRRLGRHLLEVVAPEIAEAEEAKRLEDEEQRAREKTSLRSKLIGDGLARTTIAHPVLDRDRLLTYLEAFTSPRKAQDAISGEEDQIPYHRRLGQAFGALLEHLDPDKLPAHGGDATTVMVTISLNSLREELGTGTLVGGVGGVGGEPMSATAVRRLACKRGSCRSCSVARARSSTSAAPADSSHPPNAKHSRSATKPAAPKGCTIPAAWCEAHHLKPWSQGGNTDLDDGVLTAPGTTTAPTIQSSPPRSFPPATSASTAGGRAPAYGRMPA